MEGSHDREGSTHIYRKSAWILTGTDEVVTASRLQILFYQALREEHETTFTYEIRPFCWVTGEGLIGSSRKHRGRSSGISNTGKLDAHHIVPVDWVLEEMRKNCTNEQIHKYIHNEYRNNPTDPVFLLLQKIIKITYSSENGVLIDPDYHEKLHSKCGNNPETLIEFMRIRCLVTYRQLQNDTGDKIPREVVVDGTVRPGKPFILKRWTSLMADRGLFPVNIDTANQKSNYVYKPTFLDKLKTEFNQFRSDSTNISLRRS
ncbi:MAG: hypothetical protein KatS3mg084_0384 [Candidatus Dojkabacteria bacterium]|nr:MAG: hypothetical protein KatS3mg084_0384 [Candidatus Dojkabacteria bacterium]